MNVRRTAAALTSAGALAITGVAMATPASAAPVFTGGLVNVTIVDAVDVNSSTVQIPLAIAANVCDVDLAVLVGEITDTGSADCDATAAAVADAPGPASPAPSGPSAPTEDRQGAGAGAPVQDRDELVRTCPHTT